MSEPEPKIIESLAVAKAGDFVWLFHPERNRYDEAGKYAGRGVWAPEKITGENRASFIIGWGKYARDTGLERGANARQRICGQLERNRLALLSARHKAARAIDACDDIEILKQVYLLLKVEP